MDTPTANALQRANAAQHASAVQRAKDALDAHTIHNPALFAATLLDWQATILNGLSRGIDDVLDDPACRLLVAYLAELMNVGAGFDDAQFTQLQRDVWQRAQAGAPSSLQP